MKVSRKMWLMIILKVIKNQGLTLSLEDTFKVHIECQIEPLPPPPPPPAPTFLMVKPNKARIWKGKHIDGYKGFI